MEKNEIANIVTQITVLEDDLKKYNALKKRYDDMKAELYEAMLEHEVDKLIAPNGTQFTLVKETPSESIPVVKFDENRFKKEHPEMWEDYQWFTHDYKAGRKGYVRITIPKGETR